MLAKGRKSKNADTRLIKLVLFNQLYLAPAPAIRVWLYLLKRGEIVTRTTPGTLWEEMRSDGLRISRESLSKSLRGLESVGMLSMKRSGHMMRIELHGEYK